jgi:hypothetical protein
LWWPTILRNFEIKKAEKVPYFGKNPKIKASMSEPS